MKGRNSIAAVTLMCLLLFATSALTASASRMLGKQDMSVIHGGVVKKLVDKVCGSDVPCDADNNGHCWDNAQNDKCNNEKIIREEKRDCSGWLIGSNCIQGALTGCGPKYQCDCNQPNPPYAGTCTYDQTYVKEWLNDYYKDGGPPP